MSGGGSRRGIFVRLNLSFGNDDNSDRDSKDDKGGKKDVESGLDDNDDNDGIEKVSERDSQERET